MSSMKTAYKLAAAAVRRRYAEQHPDRLVKLDRLKKSDVAVIRGTYDQVQLVLDALDVPHTMDPKSLKQRFVFLNCAGNYDAKLKTRLEAHVRSGALLVSSDWALSRVIEPMFPKTIGRAPGKSSGDEVVGIEPALESLWSDVVVLGVDPQWWVEGASEPIVVKGEGVRVEANSHELLVKYGAPAVAATFGWDAGRVFHVMSHFWLKRTRAHSDAHSGDAADFLRRGMKLSEEGIAAVFSESKVAPGAVTFGSLQSAATSSELVAHLITA